jgi:hypothetical protein
MWTLHSRQQQRGAQLHARDGKARQPGEAVADREAQEHDRAGGTAQPGDYPASPLENRNEGGPPPAPDAQAEWDRVVQPERRDRRPPKAP